MLFGVDVYSHPVLVFLITHSKVLFGNVPDLETQGL
jgi:hypothetical protein